MRIKTALDLGSNGYSLFSVGSCSAGGRVIGGKAGVERATDRAAVAVATSEMTAAGADTGPGGEQRAQEQLLA
ncbi:hypothetical protein SRHO_G00095030 [Serrasalmus rhombeus]